jgi:hypothetical protein
MSDIVVGFPAHLLFRLIVRPELVERYHQISGKKYTTYEFYTHNFWLGKEVEHSLDQIFDNPKKYLVERLFHFNEDNHVIGISISKVGGSTSRVVDTERISQCKEIILDVLHKLDLSQCGYTAEEIFAEVKVYHFSTDGFE